MLHPSTFPIIKFAMRSATAFVAHSFAPEDEDIVDQLIEFFSKLGVDCDSGKRAEPVGISDKVKKRIKEAEFFIGIFTKRDSVRDGKYSTSSWVVEEKVFAITEGKRVLLFVEEGVEDFGGMQGDLEHIPFNRENFGSSLISAIDYILAITSVKLTTRVEGNNIHISLGESKSLPEQLVELQKTKERRPQDVSVRLSLAGSLASQGDQQSAMKEFEQALKDFPNNAEVHHQFAHFYDSANDITHALEHYEKSVDLNSANPGFYRCLAKCLYKESKGIKKASSKRITLERAKRLIGQALTMNLEPNLRSQINADIFLVTEELDFLRRANRPRINR